MVVTETKWENAATTAGRVSLGRNGPRYNRYMARPRVMEASVLVATKNRCVKLATDRDEAR